MHVTIHVPNVVGSAATHPFRGSLCSVTPPPHSKYSVKCTVREHLSARCHAHGLDSRSMSCCAIWRPECVLVAEVLQPFQEPSFFPDFTIDFYRNGSLGSFGDDCAVNLTTNEKEKVGGDRGPYCVVYRENDC